MLDITIHQDRVQIGRHFSVTFERTLRIPDDGREYPLPPSLGHFPVRRVEDYADRVPPAWRAHGGVFLPMYQREAMWLNFSGAHWRPNALKVAVGKVNALSGERYHPRLDASHQDYVVVPSQPWLDGINAGNGFIRQFVAMPLGQGYTVEAQVAGEETHGGLQLACFDPKPGRFPDQPPRVETVWARGAFAAPACAPAGAGMGIAAGGRMRQQLYPDPHGLDTWDQEQYGRVFVHIVNSREWTRITREPLPSTPVDVHSYIGAGLPWFDLYDDHLGDIDPSGVLAGVKSVDELDVQHVADGVW
jgi:hypothetical protein